MEEDRKKKRLGMRKRYWEIIKGYSREESWMVKNWQRENNMWRNWKMLQITSPKQICIFETLWNLPFCQCLLFQPTLLSTSQLIPTHFYLHLEYRAPFSFPQNLNFLPKLMQQPPVLLPWFLRFLFFLWVYGTVDSQPIHTLKKPTPKAFTTSSQKSLAL